MNHRRPRLAQPFTVLTQPDTVRLVAGEDERYTLTGAGLERWLPDLLARLQGAESLETLLASLPEEQKFQARAIIDRLYGERVLVDGPPAQAHAARSYHVNVTGQGGLYDRLRATFTPMTDGPRLHILCQDNLDYAAALLANRASRQSREPFLWATYGALNRGYVSPLLLPDAGPCLQCLLATFRRLSPAPEIHDALLGHGRQQRPFTPALVPPDAIDVLHGLIMWKLEQAKEEQPAAALYHLHVLDRATMEVSTHRVFVDPECPECFSAAEPQIRNSNLEIRNKLETRRQKTENETQPKVSG